MRGTWIRRRIDSFPSGHVSVRHYVNERCTIILPYNIIQLSEQNMPELVSKRRVWSLISRECRLLSHCTCRELSQIAGKIVEWFMTKPVTPRQALDPSARSSRSLGILKTGITLSSGV